jgi:hypothetical protein
MQQLTVVGSPRYFERRGTPSRPHELLEHDCIRHRLNRARFFEWEFRIGAKDVTVDVRGRLVLDEMRAVLGAACQGSGLGLVFPTVRGRRDRVWRRRSDTRPVSATDRAVSSLLCESRAHAEQVARVHRVHATAVNWKAQTTALWITPHSRATGFGRRCIVALAVPTSSALVSGLPNDVEFARELDAAATIPLFSTRKSWFPPSFEDGKVVQPPFRRNT